MTMVRFGAAVTLKQALPERQMELLLIRIATGSVVLHGNDAAFEASVCL